MKGFLQTCTFRLSVSLSTERDISVFLDSTGEAQGTIWNLWPGDLGAPGLPKLSQLLLFQGLGDAELR